MVVYHLQKVTENVAGKCSRSGGKFPGVTEHLNR